MGRRHSGAPLETAGAASAGVGAGDPVPGAGAAPVWGVLLTWARSCVQYLSNRIKCIDKLTGGPFLE
jgi:hypothetical protein